MADQLRTVFLATHCIGNKVDSFYAYNLAETVKLALASGIEIKPLLINDTDSSIAAKNEILSIVSNTEYESVVFVGGDISWDSHALLQIINSDYDAVALPCAKKSGTAVRFDLEIGDPALIRDDNGYIKVNYASLSLFKLSSKLVNELLDSNISLTNPSGREVKNVFDINTAYGKYITEDVVVCNKIRNLGYSIWINPLSTCANIASNLFAADLSAYLVQIPAPGVSDEIKSLYQ